MSHKSVETHGLSMINTCTVILPLFEYKRRNKTREDWNKFYLLHVDFITVTITCCI